MKWRGGNVSEGVQPATNGAKAVVEQEPVFDPAVDKVSRILGGVVLNPGMKYQARQVGVTPAMARALLQGTTDQFQRGLDGRAAQAAVKRYANDMLCRNWHHSTLTLATVAGEDKYWLVNGKHRLGAVMLAGKKNPQLTVLFAVEVLQCGHVDEVKAHSFSMDIGQARSPLDLVQISGLSLEGIDRSQLLWLQSCLKVLIHGFERDSGSGPRVPQEVFEAGCVDWAPTFRAWLELPAAENDKVAGAFSEPAILSLALITLRARPDEARKFWSEVLTGKGTGWAGVASSLLGTSKLSLESLVRTLGLAWSGFVRQSPVPAAFKPMKESVKIDGEDFPISRIPLFLAGTVYDGIDFRYYSPTGQALLPSHEGHKLLGFGARYVADLVAGSPVPRSVVEKRRAIEALKKAEAEAAELARKKAAEAEKRRLEALKAAEKKRVEEVNTMGLQALMTKLRRLGWSAEDLENMSLAQFRTIALNQARPEKSAKAAAG